MFPQRIGYHARRRQGWLKNTNQPKSAFNRHVSRYNDNLSVKLCKERKEEHDPFMKSTRKIITGFWCMAHSGIVKKADLSHLKFIPANIHCIAVAGELIHRKMLTAIFGNR